MSTRNSLASYLVLLVLLLSACSPSATPSPSGATSTLEGQAPAGEPAVLRIGWLGAPDTLNPAYAFLTESYNIFDLVYNPLVTEAPSGEYVGALAKEWSSSADGLTWTFTLKDGLTWHTGEKFTAEDMAWAINAVMSNPVGWAALSNYPAGFKEVKALNDKTLQIVLENPIGNMEYRLSFLYAVYPKDFKEFSGVEDLQNFNNFEVVGTGPFKINTFDKDKGILILDANPAYVDGSPKIDQLVFQTFDNSDAMIQAIKVGDIDAILEVPASAFQTVKDFDNVVATATPARYFYELIVNSIPRDHDPVPTRNPALEDPQVRLALATAINKRDIVEIAFQGLATPLSTIVPAPLGGGFWHNSDIQDVEFNLDEANRILEAAGYRMGSDGVRAKGDVRLEFRLQFPSDNPLYARVADMMTDWFGQAGIKSIPESVDPDSLTARITPTGDYDLALWGWGPDPDPDFILSVMTSDQFVEGGWSDSGYMNPAYDALYFEQQVTLDKTQRQKIIWQMQEMVFNDRPYIVLVNEYLLQAYRSDRFTGFISSPLGIEIGISMLNAEPVQ